jgi:SNF family Na+-dependent transporter
LLGIPSAIGEHFLAVMDALATNYLLPIGALLIAVFTGWALTHNERKEELTLATLPLSAWRCGHSRSGS